MPNPVPKSRVLSLRRMAALALLALVTAFFAPCRVRGDEEKAKELLRGVDQKLHSVESFSVRFEVTNLMMERAEEQRCLVSADYDHGKMLFRIEWPDNGGRKEIYLHRDGEILSYNDRRETVDVITVLGLPRNPWVVLYDPRLIGLREYRRFEDTIEKALFLDDAEGVFTEEPTAEEPEGGNPGGETGHSVMFTQQTPYRGKVSTRFVIRQPSYRLERRVFQTESEGEGPGSYSEIRNQYDDNVSTLLPSVSTILGKRRGEVVTTYIITLKEYTERRFPRGYFTAKSMDLPINTPFTNPRIHRVIGFWNGKKMTDHLTVEQDPTKRFDRYFWFRALCFAGSALILIALFIRSAGRVRTFFKE